jgi:transcriptional regulator GlxA family with amidase domain
MMRRYPAVLNLVRDCFNQGKPVAAICHAGWVPASAGILKGKTATCFFAIKDDLINAGAKYVDEEVVVDGNLITSRTPGDLPAFCRELVKALEKQAALLLCCGSRRIALNRRTQRSEPRSPNPQTSNVNLEPPCSSPRCTAFVRRSIRRWCKTSCPPCGPRSVS